MYDHVPDLESGALLRSRRALRIFNGAMGALLAASVILFLWQLRRLTLGGSQRRLLAVDDICLYIPQVRFEWDPRKASANVRTHGVSFAEAVTALEDDFALTREDPDAVEEQRFVTLNLGLSDQASLLVVVYAYRESDVIRLISGWKANKRQRKQYEETRG